MLQATIPAMAEIKHRRVATEMQCGRGNTLGPGPSLSRPPQPYPIENPPARTVRRFCVGPRSERSEPGIADTAASTSSAACSSTCTSACRSAPPARGADCNTHVRWRWKGTPCPPPPPPCLVSFLCKASPWWLPGGRRSEL
ncbi:hypothetical protein LY76DRAFT_115305 [Colletotrichum caudatum]|nr:hypothetical protein LY76DRAFT_115305 [Colletotrichum caudatum]